MEWQVAIGTQQYAARSAREVAQWLIDGRIAWNTYVYDPRLGRWVPAHDIAEIRTAVAGAGARPVRRRPLLAVVATVGCGAILLLALVVTLIATYTGAPTSPRPAPTSRDVDRATAPPRVEPSDGRPDATGTDYAAGYERGKSEGVDHAKSGAGMPIPLGMNWMADMQAQAARPSDVDAWKRGFNDGFGAGFKSIKSFDRDDSRWEQLAWHNARPGVRLYDYGGDHEATIQRVEPSSGLIVVRYQSGEVEPKDLNAVSSYWWVRKQ